MRSGTVRCQAVARARIGTRRAFALPRGAVRSLSFGERPMHLEIGMAQAQCLIHVKALARLAGVSFVDLAVDGHPLVQAPWIEHQVIHPLRWSGDLDVRADLTHRSCTSMSRSARSTAASKSCRRTPKAAAA